MAYELQPLTSCKHEVFAVVPPLPLTTCGSTLSTRARSRLPRLKHAYTNDTADPLSLAGTCCADIAVTHGMAAADDKPIRPRAASRTSSGRDKPPRPTAAAAAAESAVADKQGIAVMAVAADHNSKPRIKTLHNSDVGLVSLANSSQVLPNIDARHAHIAVGCSKVQLLLLHRGRWMCPRACSVCCSLLHGHRGDSLSANQLALFFIQL